MCGGVREEDGGGDQGSRWSSNVLYYGQLRHPKWREWRLRIMESAGFVCQCCGADDQTLNVHHSYYGKKTPLWEYSD